MPLIEDRRWVTTPDGRELFVICGPKGALDIGPGQDWPEAAGWVTTAPGVLGILGWFRHRFIYHGAWHVQVFQRGAMGQPMRLLSSEDTPNKFAAAERVKALAAHLADDSYGR